jgi:hypothetical protein
VFYSCVYFINFVQQQYIYITEKILSLNKCLDVKTNKKSLVLKMFAAIATNVVRIRLLSSPHLCVRVQKLENHLEDFTEILY